MTQKKEKKLMKRKKSQFDHSLLLYLNFFMKKNVSIYFQSKFISVFFKACSYIRVNKHWGVDNDRVSEIRKGVLKKA